MKKLSALLLVLGLCLVPAVNAVDPKVAPQTTPKTTSPTTTKIDPKATAKVDPKATTIKAKVEEAKPIVGILIERKDSSGGFLNLKVDGGNFVITFLDKDKKEIEGDRVRAIIRFRRHLKSSQFILARSADGKSLRSSGTPVDRPYILPALPVVLFKEGQEEVAESYVVQFTQPMPGDGEGIPVDQMTPEQIQKVKK
jgi:hypothetical protein